MMSWPIERDAKLVRAARVSVATAQRCDLRGAGADKVSIGSDSVYAAEEYHRNGRQASGKTAIEAISRAYGCQAVVISGV